MAFLQDPPRLGNGWDDDPLLREYVSRALPPEVGAAIEPELRDLGELASGPLFDLQLQDLKNDPELITWDPWGQRVDEVRISPLWRRAERLAAEKGLVAAAYEGTYGRHARAHQFLLNYMVQASLDVYSCPLAMTDGAARTLLDLGHRALIERALPRLTSRDPRTAWTSGQWMTEHIGGSDVGLSETVARRGDDGSWRLYGRKWFTSAVTAPMALTLARPEGSGPGGKGLALFYVQARDEGGRLQDIRVDRLKDKLGTRKVPTAELELLGTLAEPVAGLSDGVRNITSMLNVTRTWNGGGAVWGMRRALALAKDYAARRVQFGSPLSRKPLHVDTLAGLQAEFEGAFLLWFRAVELMGRREAGEIGDADRALLRLITPVVKLTTAKQAVAVTSEVLECFGGAGYVEDTGLPLLMRDAQVLPIWEGTTNVLSLDTLRALRKGEALAAWLGEVEARVAAAAGVPELRAPGEAAVRATRRAAAWLGEVGADEAALEAGARRFALTLGRSMELALLVDHAAWCHAHGRGPRAAAAARRLAAHGVDEIGVFSSDDADLLGG